MASFFFFSCGLIRISITWIIPGNELIDHDVTLRISALNMMNRTVIG